MKNPKKYNVIAPLSNFNWNGDLIEIGKFCTIKRRYTTRMPYGYSKFLSVDDKLEIQSCKHWLEFLPSKSENLSANATINCFLFLLWLHKPTETHIKMFFENLKQEKRLHRILSRYVWIDSEVNYSIETKDLIKVRDDVDSILRIIRNNKRLFTSLTLTIRGCTAKHWHVAFICYSAAIEGLLTYSKDVGITKRLAKTYACLTKVTKLDRDKAHEIFKKTYNIRSDIMHGRAYIFNDQKSNLNELITLSNILREIWKTILTSENYINEFDKDDDMKKVFFNKIENNYIEP